MSETENLGTRAARYSDHRGEAVVVGLRYGGWEIHPITSAARRTGLFRKFFPFFSGLREQPIIRFLLYLRFE